MFDRASGVLMHLTSLPSPHGIGSMGQDAYHFVDFLEAAGQKYWQVLPLGHIGFGESPYQCYSVAAGNPYLIDLDMLREDGLLLGDEIQRADDAAASPDKVDFDHLRQVRWPLLRQAFARVDAAMQEKIDLFAVDNAEWLDDYALFMALKDHYGSRALWDWDDADVITRDPASLMAYRAQLIDDVNFYTFLQYVFFAQWTKLRAYANAHGVSVIGDIPIYVSPDSCDVWAHPELFQLKPDRSPCKVAGVPPDYYSETGQLWGNPVYDWRAHEKTGFAWWLWRIKSNMALFDVVRLDHFRGFEAYWEVDAGEETAIKGVWRKGPGMKLFRAVKKTLGDIPMIAEDLGVQTDAVRELLAESAFPGMRVLIFGFDAYGDNDHLPHNYQVNSIVYTSTHDSQSVCEQVLDICNEEERQFAYRYLRSSMSEALGWSAIKSVFASSARIAMTTMQDILSLGADARMNVPATVGQNWRWRVRREAMNPQVAAMLREITQTYKRYHAPEKQVSAPEKEDKASE